MNCCKTHNCEHRVYALGMCRKCYRKHRKTIAPEITCPKCRQTRKLYLRGLCETCYKRIRRNTNKNLGVCTSCGKRKSICSGLCTGCRNGTSRMVVCDICQNRKPYFAKNMCASCYKSHWNRNSPQEKCGFCDRMRTPHMRTDDGKALCISCYAHQRKTICPDCGIEHRGTSKFCHICYDHYRLHKVCSICKEVGSLAITEPPTCYSCYRLEYNRRPENVARQAVYTAKRRTQNKSGDFTRQKWLELMKAWGWTCAYCGVQLAKGSRSIDHMIPISKAGKNDCDNMIPCCRSCNSSKNNKLLEEWLDPVSYASFMIRLEAIGGRCNDKIS